MKRNADGKRRGFSLGSAVKLAGIVLGGILLCAVLVVGVARVTTWLSNRITTENGVDEGLYVELGGQEQYLLIRGEDVSNPVMIWLHGGPSCPDGYVNYTFQKYLVDDYTVVNWDQRGCGRTYFRNKSADPDNSTATFEQAQTDLDQLVDYLCGRFDKEKVIIIGHSYGTLLGGKYALEHPEKVAAYIGVGQVVSLESDIYAYEHALSLAKEKGDDTATMEAAYETYIAEPTLLNLMAMRNAAAPYHKAEIQTNTIWLGVASPYMDITDLRWFMKQMGDLGEYFDLNRHLYDYLIASADFREYGMEYQVPVGFITGGCDWTTPAKYAQDYCETITAPAKQIHIMDGCGHSPQYDLPEEFCALVKEMLADHLQ